MAKSIPVPRPLNLSGNVSENWKVFKRDWSNYEIASKLAKEEMEIRIATLFTCIGSDAMNLYDGFDLSADERSNINKILDAFGKHCIGETNETYERFKFNGRNQLDSETVDKYVAELRKMSKTCNFGALEEGLIRDKLVTGIKCDITRRKLLQESKLTLTKAIDIARSIEISKTQMSEIKSDSSCTKDLHLAVHKLKIKPKKKQEENPIPIKMCHFCCRSHILKKENCPAYGKTCNKCKGKNHFAQSKYCKRNVRCVTLGEDGYEDESEGSGNDAWLSAVDSRTGQPKSTAILIVNKEKVKFQLDTGADVNTICQRFVHKKQVVPTTTRLVMWNGTNVIPKGETTLDVLNPKTKSHHGVKFIVVRNDLNCLLGNATLKSLNFITVNNERFISKVEQSETLGNLGEVHLKTDLNKRPRQLPSRRVPFAIQDKVKEELNQMVKRGILMPVTEPTEWVSQMAITEKSNGKLRICIDPAHLNDALQREHYKLPTLDDVLGELKDARLFTKVDVKEAYWHVRLDEKSSYLTTMITPIGRFRWLRLPFGLKVSSEIFQRKLCEALEGLQNTINVADDIVLAGCGKTDEEARSNLIMRTMELENRCKEKNIVLNDKKTVSEEKAITFMGHCITAEGICPDPLKVEAIHNLPTPTDVSAVRRLCGTIQYLARYIPNLSHHLEPLRALTKKDTTWNWTPKCQNAFDKIKFLVTEKTKLTYFNNDKEVHLQVDSSKDGIGAVLMQDGRPIEFASKTMSETQRRWAQIEKELLAVIVGLERFDQYTYGRKVYVQNDHKPLANIIKKPLSEAPKRLQNLLMRLHRYDVEFQYLEGPKLLIADTLSRAVGNGTPHDIPEMNVNTVSSISDPMMDKIRKATIDDQNLMTLARYISEGWPDKTKCPSHILPYWQIKDNLSIENDIIYKGDQVIIPTLIRPLVKEKLHAAHLGYDSMMRRVRSTVFWPGIKDEVKQISEQCDTCQRHKPKHQKETLNPHDDGSGPWQKIGADLCEVNGENYLIAVDYFSNYIEIEYLRKTTASKIIHKLKQMFARWGIPSLIITDCGSQFVSEEFQLFLKDWNINHETSSPYHHQSNGKAESAVKAMKRLMKKAKDNNEDPFIGLLELRNTPRQYSESPSELMLGRKIRTFLPNKSKPSPPEPEKLAKRKESIKKSYDKQAKDLPPLKVNCPVYFRTPNDKWGAGKIKHANGRQYKVLSEDGTVYTRNRIHIRQKYTPFDGSYEAILASPDNDRSNPNPGNHHAHPQRQSDVQRSIRPRKPPSWHKDYVRLD